ncbi:hypothetical protein L7F22_022552 [Adiantum nelumboides]|nr:hypothetical protein [Adiantum nelumboides]
MEEDVFTSQKPIMRTRKVAPKMEAALADVNYRAQAALARLDALESDNIAMELVDADDDEEVSLEDEEHESLVYQRRHKRETRQASALEKLATAKKARSFLDLLHEANLEALPSHVPTYLRAAVGPPSSSARRHFCSVCGYFANYTCTLCGARFCCIRCQKIHTDTRCQKFVA